MTVPPVQKPANMPPRLLTHIRWPLWVAQLATGAKSFADNPLIGSRRLNTLGLHRLRVRAAHAMTRWRRRLLSGGVSHEDREAFGRQGFVEWRDVLPPEDFRRMQDAILGRVWPARAMVQGHTLTRRIPVDADMLRAVPELAALLRHPRWRGLLRYVAASRNAPHYYIQTILTHYDLPQGGAGEDEGEDYDPQNDPHADTFHSSMKAWLFLTDVALEDGPFSYVPGTHRLTPERLEWEHARALRAPGDLDPLSARGSFRAGAEDLEALGVGDPTPFPVPANTLVVADTYGFHARGTASRPSVRVELWAYSRDNPFLPWTGLHPGSIPWLANRRTHILWWLQDRFPRLAGLPLTPITDKRPDQR
ncbi:MAG TPA: phytanoyl-CoA dioxygenase family protein [Sphingobium sp.]